MIPKQPSYSLAVRKRSVEGDLGLLSDFPGCVIGDEPRHSVDTSLVSAEFPEDRVLQISQVQTLLATDGLYDIPFQIIIFDFKLSMEFIHQGTPLQNLGVLHDSSP